MIKLLNKVFIAIRAFFHINIKQNPNGFNPPFMSIKLTERCNYRCVTCNEYEIGDKSKELSLEDWKTVIKDFRELGGFSVRFTGGEPFIRKRDLFHLISFCKNLGMRVAIATNGSLITEDDIEFLKKAAIDHITISIHGSETVHDSIVGIKGSWKKIQDIVRKLKEAKLPVDIAFTILKQNLKEINFIVQYAKNLDIKVGFNIFDKNLYFFKGISSDLAPSAEEMERCSRLLVQLKRQYPLHIRGSKKGFKVIPDLLNDPSLPYYYCARTLLELFIDSFGNVMPGCWVMSPVGNVLVHSLKEILESERYKKQRMRLFNKECPGCTCGYELDIMFNFKKHKICNKK